MITIDGLSKIELQEGNRFTNSHGCILTIVFDAVALKYPFSNAKFQNVIWDVEKLIWKKKYIQGKFWNAICLVDRMHECCGWENELIIDKNNNKKYNEANH